LKEIVRKHWYLSKKM